MDAIYLTQLPMNGRVLIEWAMRKGMVQTPRGTRDGRPRSAELGYALHAAVTQLFGTPAPRPFVHLAEISRHTRASSAFSASSASLQILGYTRVNLDSLRTLGCLQTGELSALIDWGSARSKPLPKRWPAGLRLQFDVRACPVRRIRRPLAICERQSEHGQRTTYSTGSEVDAYQVAVGRALESGDPLPTREEAYIDWLKNRLGCKNKAPRVVALSAESTRVMSFNSVRVLRRTQGMRGRRSAHWLTRPAVHYRGLLEILMPEEFGEFLLQGVGRHVGFGFGMLLLKPA